MSDAGESNVGDARDWVQRNWIDALVDKWIAAPNERILNLVGQPGSGKSVYAAQLGKRLQSSFDGILISYVCRSLDDASINPLRFVEALSDRLCSESTLYRDVLLQQLDPTTTFVGTASAASVDHGTVAGINIGQLAIGEMSSRNAFDRLVRKPFQQAEKRGFKTPILVIVDGLDEALSVGGDDTISGLLERLASQEDKCPANLRFFLTFRSSEPRLQPLLKQQTIDLEQHQNESAGDINNYLTAVTGPDAKPDRTGALMAHAKGNFLIAYHYLHLGIDPDEFNVELDVPETIVEIYDRFLHRECISDVKWLDLYRPVLGMIAISRGKGLSRQQLQGALDFSATDLDRAMIKCRALLATAGADGPYRFFHDTFRAYLSEKNSAGEIRTDTEAAYQALTDYLYLEHEDHWLEPSAGYARSYLITHLLSLATEGSTRSKRQGALNRVVSLLAYPQFVYAQIVHRGPRTYLEDTKQAASHSDFAQLPELLRERHWLLNEAVRISGSILALDAEQFASQMHARIPKDTQVSVDLLAELDQLGPPVWLRPRIPAPMAVGTPVQWVYDGLIYVYSLVVSTVAQRLLLCTEVECMIFDLVDGSLVETIAFERRWGEPAKLMPDGLTAVIYLHGSFSDRRTEMVMLNLSTLETTWATEASGDITSIAISDSTNYWACCDSYGTDLRDATTGELIRRYRRPADCVVILSDGDSIVFGTKKGLYLTNIASADEPQKLPFDIKATEAVALDNKRAAFAGESATVYILDLDAGSCEPLLGAESAINCLAWDSARLHAGTVGGELVAWDLASGEVLWNYVGHTMRVYCIVVADGVIYSGSKDSRAKAWDPQRLAAAHSSGLVFDFVRHVAISADGLRIASDDQHNRITTYDIDPAGGAISMQRQWDGHRQKEVKGIKFLEAPNELLTIGQDMDLKIWDIDRSKRDRKGVERAKLVKRISAGPKTLFSSFHLSRDVPKAIVRKSDEIKIIDWTTDEFFTSLEIDGYEAGILCTGELIVDSEEKLAIYDASTGEQIKYLRDQSPPKGIVPDTDEYFAHHRQTYFREFLHTNRSSYLFGIKSSGTVEIIDLDSGQTRLQVQPHKHHVHGLDVIESLAAAVSVGMEDRWIKIWQISDGRELCTYTSDGGWWCCAVSEDGKMVVAGDDDSGLCVFDVMYNEPLQH